MITLIILSIAWWLSGALSFCYWWTRDYDLTTKEITLACFSGIFGPIAFAVGSMFHGKSHVIWRRKR